MASNTISSDKSVAKGHAQRANLACVGKSTATLPVLPNVFPYNEMLFRNILVLENGEHGLCGVKSRSWNYHYRGPILLYTSKSRMHFWPADRYDIELEKGMLGAIVGIGDLVDVREFTRAENVKMESMFNKIELSQDELRRFARVGCIGGKKRSLVDITPYYLGFFFKNLRRFGSPIPFNFRRGSIRLDQAPISLVVDALRKIRFDLKLAA
ncbi:MAG TPA: hypothetical protein VNG29_00570 [Candidatus Paceibacterota bacterium]|nr:hypothetical protein [Candidatus Paceibacterota bacterium]